MKINVIKIISCLFFLLWGGITQAAVTKTTYSAMAAESFLFIENNSDDNYFVTPLVVRDPRMTGSNKWTGLKYGGTGTIYQQSLGYIDNGFNTQIPRNWMFDMWIENLSISYPLTGLRCINWYNGCNMSTSLLDPQSLDSKGFYGSKVTGTGAVWQHGMMAEGVYQYLQQMPIGTSLTLEINTCQTSVQYDASQGERCINQSSGAWHIRPAIHNKVAHLRLINTQSLSEIFINTDGIPTLSETSGDCKMQTIAKLNGISCKLVNYNLQTTGLSNSGVHIFPSITNAALDSAVKGEDMQFSLNGSSWKNYTSYYTFNDIKNANAIYVFFSSNFFKQMVNQGMSDINTKDLFNFRFQNTLVPESGWYEFSTSNQLIIKPRDFGVSIISDEFISNPHKEGEVKRNAPSLDFGYIITTSGKTAADEVMVKVKGPATVLSGQSYCMFSSSDGTTQVPFPAKLTFTTESGAKKLYDTGCDDQWHDITNALWSSTPWNDASGDVGTLEKTNVVFSILMNDPISERTVDNNNWYGEVSASGEIHVKATWRNVN